MDTLSEEICDLINDAFESSSFMYTFPGKFDYWRRETSLLKIIRITVIVFFLLFCISNKIKYI